MCIGGPKIPTPAPAPAAPQAINPATQGASATAIQRAAAASVSSTQLTGPQGALGANNAAGKTLLGG